MGLRDGILAGPLVPPCVVAGASYDIGVESYGRTIMIFRRPELEKDNPIAPEPYVGPRRRLAMARAVGAGKSAEAGDVMEALQVLTAAADRVVKHLSNKRKTDGDLEILREAVAQAERMLSAQKYSLSPSKLKI